MSWNIRNKLLAGFTGAALLTLLLGGFTLARMSSMDVHAAEVTEKWLPAVKAIGQVRALVNRQHSGEMTYLLKNSEEGRGEYEQKIAERRAAVAEAVKAYEPLISSPEERALHEKFPAHYKQYVQLVDGVMEGERRGASGNDIMAGPAREMFDEVTRTLTDNVELNNRGADMAAAEGTTAYSSGRYWVIGAVLVTFAFST